MKRTHLGLDNKYKKIKIKITKGTKSAQKVEVHLADDMLPRILFL